MIFIDELKDMKLYRKKFFLPREKDKKKGVAVMLLTPNYESSKNIMNHNLILKKYYNSYYIEKNVSLFINEQTNLLEMGSNLNKEIQSKHLEGITENTRYINTDQFLITGDKNSIDQYYDLVMETLVEYTGKFKIHINSPVNIIFTNRYEYGSNTDKEIYLPSYGMYDSDMEEAIIKECIINFILRYRFNSDTTVIDIISTAYSGLYDILLRDGILDEDNDIYRLCDIVKNDTYPITDILNRDSKLFKDISLKEDGNNSNSEENNDPIDSIKQIKGTFSSLRRNITMSTRKAGAHKIDKINSDISDTTADSKYSSTPTTNPPESVGEEVISLYEATQNENYMKIGNSLTYFDEATASNKKLKDLLYRERLRTTKDTMMLYDRVKKDNPFIAHTYINLARYKSLNIFIDLYYYNQLFFANNTYNTIQSTDLYYTLMRRQINNIKLSKAGYNKKVVIVPVKDWLDNPSIKGWLVKSDINPISIIYKLLRTNISTLRDDFKDVDFLFLGDVSYFKLNFNSFDDKQVQLFLTLIKKVINGELPSQNDEIDERPETARSIKASITDDIEDGLNVTIMKSLTGEKKTEMPANDELKEKIEDIVDKAAASSNSKADALEKLDNDDEFKAMILDLSTSEVNSIGPTVSKARKDRSEGLQKAILAKKVKGQTINDLITTHANDNEVLKAESLNINVLDESWNNITFPSQSKQYDPDKDILEILLFLAKRVYPINLIDINIDDTSTSEDYVYTYTAKMEDFNGKRFTIKFDIPKLKDSQYMKLRGNRKSISAQSFLLPVVKTDDDTCQVVSNYSKIFIRRFGTTQGKSFIDVDKIIKSLSKYEGKGIKVTTGNASGVCVKYDLPIDYIDLAGVYNLIETKDVILYFNQFDLRNKYKDKLDLNLGIPIGVSKATDTIIYSDSNVPISTMIVSYLAQDKEFAEIYNSSSRSVRYTYSKASILNTAIPLAVLCSYHVGIFKMLELAGIKYEISKSRIDKKDSSHDYIKFNDGNIIYENTLESSLLMNGFKECDTENYSLRDINSKFMYMDFLDQFGGRIKADGLDNFADLFIDPITEKILEHFNLPKTYIELLLYANSMLANNKYTLHSDISDGKRLRRNELIAGYAYKAISSAYGSYAIQAKHGRDMALSIKQSAIIDLILQDPTSGDLSIINPLNEKETYDSVSSKGLSGMNSDRAYGLAERQYGDSMKGVLAMSTGFAGNTGISRQATINANISGIRGYINQIDTKDMNTTNTLCMTEALTPFGSTHDDPIRTAMSFIQTSKHSMRCKHSSPSLVSNGADQALPYMVSNIFCTKSKFDGIVEEITDDYMIIKQNTSNSNTKSEGKVERMYVDLTERVEKNSSSGFFVTIKQDTDLKVGDRVKDGEIIAYDKSSFSKAAGPDDNLAYEIGTLAKCAIINTDEGFEDSAIMSENLATAMSTSVVVEKQVTIPKDTNVFNLIKPGKKIEEGDTLLVMQTPFDSEDANLLLKNLADDEESISELGRIPIRAKITGVVQDVQILRTVDYDEMSESLAKICKEYDNRIEKQRKIMKKYNIEQQEELPANYKLPPTGILKDAADSVKIRFFLRYEDKVAVGDKIIYYSALKGTTKTVFPKGLEPFSEYRPNEIVDTFLPIASINGRMIGSVMLVGCINKMMVELARQTKDIAGIPYPDSVVDAT